jgi:hypothetical protein
MISTKKPDDKVGEGRKFDNFEQTPEQAAIVNHQGEDTSIAKPEPKSPEDWAARGASGGEPGRSPVALGGNSQGQGDRMPTGGASVSNEPSSNPAYVPGNKHEQ